MATPIEQLNNDNINPLVFSRRKKIITGVIMLHLSSLRLTPHPALVMIFSSSLDHFTHSDFQNGEI